MPEKFFFPKDFMWGTSISTTQTEGNNDNDWSDIVVSDGNKVGEACDHYNRYKEDFKLAADMNNNCIRLGVEWSRLQKEAFGELDSKEVEHYREYLGEAKEFGLEPMVVLHHFANPKWFSEKKGWTRKGGGEVFADYAKKTIREFSDLVDMWNIFNETNIFATNSYLFGVFPPYKHNLISTYQVKRNMEKAHKEAYLFAKELGDNLVSSTTGWRPTYGSNWFNEYLGQAYSYYVNEWFTDEFMKYSDYFGLSYYGDTYLHKLVQPVLPMLGAKKEYIESLGLRGDDFNLLTPEKMGITLEKVAERYGKPIFIVENGFATEDGKLREEMIVKHLQETARSIKKGLDIRGYIHWSLMDNFEWDHGYTKCFGIYGVDFKSGSLERIKREGVDTYAKICKENAIEL